MSATKIIGVTLCCLALVNSVQAQRVPAIPVTVRALVKTPPRMGQLIKVSGYLDTSDKEPRLQDTSDSRKIILDFSRSSVTLDSLRGNATAGLPVLIIGRMQGTKDNGKPVIGVIGAINLTP